MNILEEIILFKKLEVAERKRDWSIEQLEKSKQFGVPAFSLKKALQDPSATGIIAEFKRRSPSKGVINNEADVKQVTKAYTDHGATGLSVLTEEKFFGGLVPDLLKARDNKIPILRKDFIIDEYQVIASKSFGADVVLLIAACLSPYDVRSLAITAKNIGLEILLEIHNEEELDHICDEVDLVGVNNRDLRTFGVSTETSLRLINKIPREKPAISESGIHSIETLLNLKLAGVSGFLIGEIFMKEMDPGEAFRKFVQQLQSSPGRGQEGNI
jgi:indole-3-glycerol phosphate synthase